MADFRVVDERDIVQIAEPVFRVWKILDPVNRGVEVVEANTLLRCHLNARLRRKRK